MLIFWFICAMMVLLALWFVLPALWQTGADAKTGDARAANLLVYQDQLRELAADLKSGLLSEAQYEQDKEELERRLLDDVGDGKQSRLQSNSAVARWRTRSQSRFRWRRLPSILWLAVRKLSIPTPLTRR